MTTWYRTGGWRGDIEPVEVVSFTEKMVTFLEPGYLNPSRALRSSNHSAFFETWEEAKAHLVKEAQRKVLFARRQLDLANAHLGNMKGLKNVPLPEPPKFNPKTML